MSFDQDSTLPLMNPHKWTTKVNLALAAGVIAFFLLALVGGWWAWDRAGRTNAEPVPPERQQTP